MQLIYIILFIVSLIYIIFRKIDLLSLGIASFMIYHIYALEGYVFIHSRIRNNLLLYSSDIIDELYVMLILQLLILISITLFYDYITKKSNKSLFTFQRSLNKKGVYISFVILGIISLFYYAIDIMQVGVHNISGNKSQVWERVGTFYVFSLWTSMALFAYAINEKKYYLLLIALPPILIHFYIGSRPFFVVLVIISILYYGKFLKRKYIKRAKLYTFSLLALFFVMIYRQIYANKNDISLRYLYELFTNPESYEKVLRFGEARIVLANYNYILESKFSLEIMDIFSRFISFIPYANRLVDSPNNLLLSSIIRNKLNADYGLASNFWVEGYAMFGYIGILFFTIVWGVILAYSNKYIYSKNWNSYFILPFVVYIGFYIHRMDFTKVIGNAKFLIFSAIIWWIINSVITRNWTISYKKIKY